MRPQQKTIPEIIADVQTSAHQIADNERDVSTLVEDSVRAVMNSRELIARVEAMLARR